MRQSLGAGRIEISVVRTNPAVCANTQPNPTMIDRDGANPHRTTGRSAERSQLATQEHQDPQIATTQADLVTPPP